MKPIVHGLEANYKDRIGFVYLDIDDARTAFLKQQLGYRYMPQFFLVDGQGRIQQAWLGLVTREEFVRAFERVLAPR